MQLTDLNTVYTAIQAECCHSLLQIQSEPEQGKSPSANIVIECVPGSGIVLNFTFFFGCTTQQVESQFLDQGSNPLAFTGSTGAFSVACPVLGAAASGP